jgi:hypothetical protein
MRAAMHPCSINPIGKADAQAIREITVDYREAGTMFAP